LSKVGGHDETENTERPSGLPGPKKTTPAFSVEKAGVSDFW
jgi:hypothetical protein